MSNYDPNKTYTWKPEDKFELDGRQLGAIMGVVKSVLNTEEARKVQTALYADSIIQSIIAQGVESGIVKETKPEEPAPESKL